LGDQDAAQNLASDCFYRLLVAFREGNGPRADILPWLYRTAHNLVIDLYRKSSQQTLPLEETLIAAKDHSPEDALMDMQEQEQVRAALGLLTDEQQQVITLKFIEGLTNEEVAKIMKISVGAVKSMQYRALASLARVLRQAPAREGRRSTRPGKGLK
jgi:RNA polymerase sigma-70 factor, ECF subfamily